MGGGLDIDFDNTGEDGTDQEVGSACDETNGAAEVGAKDNISEVRGSSLWASLRDYLTPADVLVLRAAGAKVVKMRNCMVIPHEKKRW